jgi:hypothetical protein
VAREVRARVGVATNHSIRSNVILSFRNYRYRLEGKMNLVIANLFKVSLVSLHFAVSTTNWNFGLPSCFSECSSDVTILWLPAQCAFIFKSEIVSY